MANTPTEYLPLSTLGAFPVDWQEATLASVCYQVTDGTHDSPKPVAEGGFPLVTGKAIKNRKIDFSVTYNISEEEHKQVIARSDAKKDDILFANIGNSIGDLVRVQTDRTFSIKNVALFKPNKEKIHPRYLEYFLLSEQVQGFIRGATRGSAQPFIGLSTLRGFPVAVPPLSEQLEIGATLGVLDDRITLLHENNATLEAIAQALFKSWFVDFDPVRAKQLGSIPEGIDEATAALFPDSFEESELGLMPKGWRVGTLGDISQTMRQLLQPSELSSDMNYVGLEHIPRKSLSLDSWSDASSLGSTKTAFNKGDILFGKLRPYFHKVVIAPFKGVCSTDILVCKPILAANYGILAMHLFSDEVIQYSDRLSNGAKMPRIGWKDLAAFSIVVPPVSIAKSYSDLVEPIFNRMIANTERIQTLATLRDTLLPRLISGQLRLADLDSAFEEAIA